MLEPCERPDDPRTGCPAVLSLAQVLEKYPEDKHYGGWPKMTMEIAALRIVSACAEKNISEPDSSKHNPKISCRIDQLAADVPPGIRCFTENKKRNYETKHPTGKKDGQGGESKKDTIARATDVISHGRMPKKVSDVTVAADRQSNPSAVGPGPCVAIWRERLE